MGFNNQTFLGASVVSYTSNIGWGVGSPSQIQVNLVEDPVNGDSFLPFRVGNPQVGQPVYFNHYGFSFSGLLQKWEEKQSRDGMPVFDAIVVDPREILDGAQVILNGYNGSVGGVFNIFNVFGWWENAAGFGGSEANDTGMPWTKVYYALLGMANTPNYTDWGGPLNYRGFQYGLDLSELPNPPAYYRVGGPGGQAANLLELIAQVCEDGGCDFFVELDGLTIVIRTVQRIQNAPLGTITAITNTNWGGSVVRSNNGLENRNELTSAFLVGGDVTSLNMTTSLTQFWGFDFYGNPITGTPSLLWFPGPVKNAQSYPPPILSPNQPASAGGFSYNQVGTDVYEVMNLNSAPIADILGSVIYQCSTLEMRLAKANFQSWQQYMLSCRPDIATLIGMTFIYQADKNQQQGQVNPTSIPNDEPANAQKLADAAVAGEVHVREQRVYQFVRGYADAYMGLKFLASVPFVLYETDAETLQVRTSYEVSDGGYLPEGSAPLGLSSLNEDIFMTQDGRFRAFCRFDGISAFDLSSVSPQGTAVEGDSLFMSVGVATQVVYTPSPAVVVTLASPIFAQANDAVGDLNIVSAVGGAQPDAMKKALQQSYISLSVAPAAQIPTAIAIPLKSNILTYGPWFSQGAAGKVKVDIDSTLTPWNYGGFDQMNQAGNIRVASVLTNMQVSETGVIELAGTPTISLGDALQSGGPNLSGIDVQISTSGVTTSYRFATFTPKFGVFSKGYIERLRRMSISAMQLRREVRVALRKGVSDAAAIGEAARSARAFMELAPAAFKRQSPHDVLATYSYQFGDDVLTLARSATYPEIITLSNANSSTDWQQTAVMSMTGLIRPFCTNPNSPSGFFIPSYTEPDNLVSSDVPNAVNLNPWKAKNDIEVYGWGSSYQGLHAYRRDGDFANARAIALRGPLVVAGWGYTINGGVTPDDGSGGFLPGYLTHQNAWNVGPVDLLWNPWAGTWTCHDVLRGQLSTPCPASSSGLMSVMTLNGSGAWQLPVWNHFGTAVSGGKNVICGYVSTDHRWYIIAADC